MNQSSASLWDRESPKYLHREITAGNSWLRPDFLPTRSDRVLDAGCGSGNYLRYFSQFASDLHGVDISSQMILRAVQYGQCEVGDITKLSYPDQAYTYILSFLSANHCDQPDRAFSEFGRLLKPGGVLVLIVPNKRSLLALERRFMMSIGKYSLGRCEHYSVRGLREQLVKYGLSVEDHYVFTRRPEATTWVRQLFALPAYAFDFTLNSLFSTRWGECIAVRARKI